MRPGIPTKRIDERCAIQYNKSSIFSDSVQINGWMPRRLVVGFLGCVLVGNMRD